MKSKIVLIRVMLVIMLLLFVNSGFPAVVQGSVYTGVVKSSKSGKSWSAVLKITSHDPQTGKIEGELQWPQLGSLHRIAGNLLDGKLTFKETEYFRKGGAFLNCEYVGNLTDKAITGSWNYLAEDQGSFQLSRQEGTGEAVIPAVDLAGTVWLGEAKSTKSSRSWSATLTFVKHDTESGSLEGRLEWPSLAAVHKIVGNFADERITFRETEFIRKGSALLNCEYSATLKNNTISGSWSDPKGDKGTFQLRKK